MPATAAEQRFTEGGDAPNAGTLLTALLAFLLARPYEASG